MTVLAAHRRDTPTMFYLQPEYVKEYRWIVRVHSNIVYGRYGVEWAGTIRKILGGALCSGSGRKLKFLSSSPTDSCELSHFWKSWCRLGICETLVQMVLPWQRFHILPFYRLYFTHSQWTPWKDTDVSKVIPCEHLYKLPLHGLKKISYKSNF